MREKERSHHPGHVQLGADGEAIFALVFALPDSVPCGARGNEAT